MRTHIEHTDGCYIVVGMMMQPDGYERPQRIVNFGNRQGDAKEFSRDVNSERFPAARAELLAKTYKHNELKQYDPLKAVLRKQRQ